MAINEDNVWKNYFYSTTIRLIRLESSTIFNKDYILSSKSSSYLIININLGPKNYKVFTLLDSIASICFLDEKFIKKI